MSRKDWYRDSYRRNLIDMHIDDWNEAFFSRLTPQNYVEIMKKGNIRSAMIYANSHVGLCNWPTKYGVMHKGLNGRDFLGEVIDLCHKENIDVIVYYSMIYDNWAYDHDEAWRILDDQGLPSRVHIEDDLGMGTRYGICCPNSPGYKQHSLAQIQDLLDKYTFEGMYFDMLFWPIICHCDNCRSRFKRETGYDFPSDASFNWNSPVWKVLNQKKQDWMNELAESITNLIKSHDPDISVQHQFASSVGYWRRGLGSRFAQYSDYIGADLYGGIDQQSFICKFFNKITKNPPFEYQTSRCDPDLHFHTATKSKEYLSLQNYIALAHNGAFMFIDAIDPVGTINPALYETMGDVFSQTKCYDKYLGGDMTADVAVYFCMDSKMDLESNDIKDTNNPHLKAALACTRILRQNHIPFAVLNRTNLDEFPRYKTLILPDIGIISKEEALATVSFLKNGGNAYISAHSSNKDLLEALGITSVTGKTKENFTYISPSKKGEGYLPKVDRHAPLTTKGSQILVSVADDVAVLAYTVLPYTDPKDSSVFASIHSNPPGIDTDFPAVIERTVGKGRAIWTSYPIESDSPQISRECFLRIINDLTGDEVFFKTDAPPVVEIVAFSQKEKNRTLISLINQQEIFPQIPVLDFQVSVKIPDANRIVFADSQEECEWTKCGNYIRISIPRLDMFKMILVEQTV